MKITLQPVRPRNPLVAAARLRKAGSHRRSTGAVRLRLARATAGEVRDMKNDPH